MLPPSLPQPGVQRGWGSTHRWVPTELSTRQEWGTPTPALGLPGTGAMQNPSLEPQHPALHTPFEPLSGFWELLVPA